MFPGSGIECNCLLETVILMICNCKIQIGINRGLFTIFNIFLVSADNIQRRFRNKLQCFGVFSIEIQIAYTKFSSKIRVLGINLKKRFIQTSSFFVILIVIVINISFLNGFNESSFGKCLRERRQVQEKQQGKNNCPPECSFHYFETFLIKISSG